MTHDSTTTPAVACATTPSVDGGHGYIADRQNYLDRLRRIEGQIKGLARMVETDRYCIEILTQIAAATSGLENVALGLVNDHLHHCVLDAASQGGRAADARIAEAFAAITRLVKS